MEKIIIYSPFINNKLNYVLSFLFGEILPVEYQINLSSADNERWIRICSTTNIEQEIKIKCSSYLQSDNIFDYNEALSDALPIVETNVNFDVFAAIFYLLARVEEYDHSDLDAHGRFLSHNSILSKSKLLELPVIDRWIASLKILMDKYLDVKLAYKRSYRFQSTIDIDHFFAFRNKGFKIYLASAIKDLLTLKFKRLKHRFYQSDPYDCIDDMVATHRNLGIEAIFFILCSERGKYDKNISPDSIAFKKQLIALKNNIVGIHPSYASDTFAERLEKEKDKLESLLERNVRKSRQHYLKMKLPDSYRNLIDVGIKEEYSMGYADRIGFRAGTSYPFLWYDVLDDKLTDLRVFPFQMMDVTLKKYMNLDPQNAIIQCQRIIDEIRKHNGYCSLIWHNSSFFELESWSGWKAIYSELLSYAKA